MWQHLGMSDELVQIWSTGDATIAELTRARLEGEGIDVLVKSSMGGSSAYPVGPSYLFVKAEQEQDARAIIAAIEAGEFALDEGRRRRLALRVLRRLAGLLQAVLAAFLLAGVAPEVPLGLELRAELGVELHQRPRDAEAHGPGLAGDAAAADRRDDVVVALAIDAP